MPFSDHVTLRHPRAVVHNIALELKLRDIVSRAIWPKDLSVVIDDVATSLGYTCLKDEQKIIVLRAFVPGNDVFVSLASNRIWQVTLLCSTAASFSQDVGIGGEDVHRFDSVTAYSAHEGPVCVF